MRVRFFRHVMPITPNLPTHLMHTLSCHADQIWFILMTLQETVYFTVVLGFTPSLLKNVQIFLEWLNSDSEPLCSLFRLQHAFIKSRWYPDYLSLRLEKNHQFCAHSYSQTLYNTFLLLLRLLHARSHDQTCIIPRPSH